jgi:type II secretory pathway component PulF
MPNALTACRTLDDSRDRAELYRTWCAGFEAGFTHPQSLESMGGRASPHVEEARRWLLAGTRQGRSIAELAHAGGRRFEEMEVALLSLGEESGRLDRALRILGEYFTRKHRLMLWVKKQMAYPLITALAACFIAPLPLLFFGHSRAYVVASFGTAAMLMLAAGGIVLSMSRRYARRPALCRARMARGLATAIEAGLPLGRALTLAANASANPEIRAFVLRQSERELSGQSIVASLAGCPHMTPEFIAVVDTAERTGDFGAVARLADLYEDGFR